MNRYIGAVSLGFSPAGTRIGRKVTGRTKTAVRDKLRELHKQVVGGLRPRRRYTVEDAEAPSCERKMESWDVRHSRLRWWQAGRVHGALGIEHERAVLAGELAGLTGIEPAAAERAIVLSHERHPVGRRNLVSVLATVAQLNALLAATPDAQRQDYLTRTQADGRTWLDRLLGGELDRIAAQVCDAAAGPYDVSWDGNWPSLRPRLRGRIPASARAGDLLAGGDGAGTRIAICVVEDDDGVLTGGEVPGSWRDPPFEDVWLATYRRLERLYPGAIPPPSQS